MWDAEKRDATRQRGSRTPSEVVTGDPKEQLCSKPTQPAAQEGAGQTVPGRWVPKKVKLICA